MSNPAKAREIGLLTELTAIPTAAGHEQRVIRFVESWALQRGDLRVERDGFGNVILSSAGPDASAEGRSRAGGRSLIIEAHLDHPAFAIEASLDEGTWLAMFRGGVADAFFAGSPVRVWPAAGRVDFDTVPDGETEGPIARGVVDRLDGQDEASGFKRAVLRLEPVGGSALPVQAGDFATWDLPGPEIVSGDGDGADANPGRDHSRLLTPVADNLTSVAASLAMLDRLLEDPEGLRPGVSVLLTRAEEVGFIGAIAACKSGRLPADARVVVLENSKSFSESPLGGGVIVRVGDRSSVFDPGLLAELVEQAQALAGTCDAQDFAWQRRLMPGGTCNASAYAAFGYTAACLCLPLGRYHNMNEATGRIDREMIAPADFGDMVTLLTQLARSVGATDPDGDIASGPSLRDRLDQQYRRLEPLLAP